LSDAKADAAAAMLQSTKRALRRCHLAALQMKVVLELSVWALH
jgi:hypothetical protein